MPQHHKKSIVVNYPQNNNSNMSSGGNNNGNNGNKYLFSKEQQGQGQPVTNRNKMISINMNNYTKAKPKGGKLIFYFFYFLIFLFFKNLRKESLRNINFFC